VKQKPANNRTLFGADWIIDVGCYRQAKNSWGKLMFRNNQPMEVMDKHKTSQAYPTIGGTRP
jgi:2-oxoglutarate dehydrogenase complex dehydrogenase (E1) component-like enzyme